MITFPFKTRGRWLIVNMCAFVPLSGFWWPQSQGDHFFFPSRKGIGCVTRGVFNCVMRKRLVLSAVGTVTFNNSKWYIGLLCH